MLDFESSLKEFTDYLLKNGRAEATVIAYRKDIDQMFDYLKGVGIGSLDKVTTESLKNFMTYLGDKLGFSNKTVSRKTNSVKTYYRFLIAQGYIKENVSLSLEHPKFENKAPRVLTQMEYRALRDVVKENIRTAALVEVLLQTGVRISEVADLRLSDITFGKEGKVFVRGHSTIPERTIPLNDTVQKLIKQYLDTRQKVKNDFLFITRSNKQLLVRNIRAVLKRSFQKAGLNDVTVNDLRHTFLTTQLTHGIDVKYLAEILGHRRVTTTEKYLQYVSRSDEKRHDLVAL